MNEGYNLSGASDIRLGSNTVTAIYYGSTLLWPLVPRDYSKEYLTIKSRNYGETLTISFIKNSPNISRSIQYSKDKINWTTISFNTSDNPTQIELNPSEKIYLKGTNSSYSEASDSGLNSCRIIVDGKVGVDIYGNIMSLIYGDNFYGQTVLTSDYTFTYLFSRPRSANYVPNMIADASNLILPATTLTKGCYREMFYSCTGLLTPPMILPATTLADSCYKGMFYNCESLVTAPVLPATTLAYRCYSDMFKECENLRDAPVLPATTLAEGCYYSMFRACHKLTVAPVLPATTLAYDCYREMFYSCANLTTAPDLAATTLKNGCYKEMFRNCTKINYIKCLATDIREPNSLTYWVNGVASTGTFVKNPNMTNWTTGTSGIPSGWTVQDAS